MYLNSLAFKAMESGLKQLNVKQQVHTQNIANIDTPDYDYKYVTFENTLDEKVDGKRKYDFKAKVTEVEHTDVLIDGNNVDVDKENGITIDFHVIVSYGVSISTVTDNLISTVKYKVESFTGMQIKKINIYVEGVRVID